MDLGWGKMEVNSFCLCNTDGCNARTPAQLEEVGEKEGEEDVEKEITTEIVVEVSEKTDQESEENTETKSEVATTERPPAETAEPGATVTQRLDTNGGSPASWSLLDQEHSQETVLNILCIACMDCGKHNRYINIKQIF